MFVAFSLNLYLYEVLLYPEMQLCSYDHSATQTHTHIYMREKIHIAFPLLNCIKNESNRFDGNHWKEGEREEKNDLMGSFLLIQKSKNIYRLQMLIFKRVEKKLKV